MSESGGHPEWHIRIDRAYHFNRAGQGAFEKAEELASQTSEAQKYWERLAGKRTDEGAWRKGAIGEQAVGRRLDRLPHERWAVVHDVTIGSRGANLDHLVIGAPGVFAVNTKHLSGTVTVYDRAILRNGQKTDFVVKALREARTVQSRMGAALGRPVPVWSVIVVMGARMAVRSRPANLTVLDAWDVPQWFVHLPGESIDRGLRLTLERIARSPETWHAPRRRRGHVSQPPPPDPAHALPMPRSPSTEPVDGVVVRRWRKYGKDRLYVNTRDGASLGYRDLITGDVALTAPEHRELVDRATREWQRRNR